MQDPPKLGRNKARTLQERSPGWGLWRRPGEVCDGKGLGVTLVSEGGSQLGCAWGAHLETAEGHIDLAAALVGAVEHLKQPVSIRHPRALAAPPSARVGQGKWKWWASFSGPSTSPPLPPCRPATPTSRAPWGSHR